MRAILISIALILAWCSGVGSAQAASEAMRNGAAILAVVSVLCGIAAVLR